MRTLTLTALAGGALVLAAAALPQETGRPAPAPQAAPVGAVATAATGATEGDEIFGTDCPIADALDAVPEAVRIYDEHVVTLSSPWMEGRLPGTQGMEHARDYCEFWLVQAGVEAPWTDAEGRPSYRQGFALAGRAELVAQEVAWDGSKLVADEDYTALPLGTSGDVTAPAVFVGYSIDDGPDGWSSYPEGADLTGKVAVMYRFEPMDAEGRSAWAPVREGQRGTPWSGRASFQNKVEAAAERGAAAILILNPPDSADPRSRRLVGFNSSGNDVDVPVAMLSLEAGEALAAAAGEAPADWRALADEGGAVRDLGLAVTVRAEIDRSELMAENVAGVLRGRGELADQVVVMGAHLDHLGMGNFGSRAPEAAGRELHPGADDNASGSAAVLMLADRLTEYYASLPEDQPTRTLVFMLFDGEESGLNGARHYTEQPLGAIEDHALMLNFDMIGRLVDGRLSISGLGSGEGLGEFALPYFEDTPLTVVPQRAVSPNSDHWAFYQRRVPVLFAILADIGSHPDYHRPSDTSDKLNRVAAVQTIDLFERMLQGVATTPDRFAFQTTTRANRRDLAARAESEAGAPTDAAAPVEDPPAPPRTSIGVRFGIMPGDYAEGIGGVPVGGVSPDGPADAAGLQAGDRIVAWNGEEVEDVVQWMGLLARHEPGDEVRVTVERGEERLDLTATLEAPQRQDG